MRKRKAECPRCKIIRRMTSHHILPKTFFHGKGDRQKLCKYCHRKFEKILELFEGKTKEYKRKQLPVFMYVLLLRLFIRART